jgi:hypothetical protein
MSGQFDDVTRAVLVVVVVGHVFFRSTFLEGAGIFHKERSSSSLASDWNTSQLSCSPTSYIAPSFVLFHTIC